MVSTTKDNKWQPEIFAMKLIFYPFSSPIVSQDYYLSCLLDLLSVLNYLEIIWVSVKTSSIALLHNNDVYFMLYAKTGRDIFGTGFWSLSEVSQ